MISANTVAKGIMALTFCVLCTLLVQDQKFVSLLLFSAVFIFGVAIHRRQYFWKVALVFFGLLSVIYSFRVFGGLEPNSPGTIAAKGAFGIETVLFMLLVLSLIASAIVGMRTSRH